MTTPKPILCSAVKTAASTLTQTQPAGGGIQAWFEEDSHLFADDGLAQN
jgi:hypothetical protein